MLNITKECMELRPTIEIAKGELLKTGAEVALAGLSRFGMGEKLLERYAFGMEGRLDNPALHVVVGGIEYESPVMVGAGWDKKGRAVRGLYDIGFSAVEVGTVPLFGQPGNIKPRLWTLDSDHSVGLNRLGFNSPGSEAVDRYLAAGEPFPCPVGVNVGKNKLMPDEQSPWAHAQVVKNLYKYASYFVFNPSSPNTPGLRNLQQREPLIAHVRAMQAAMAECGEAKPLYVKIAPDMTMADFYEIIDVCLEMGVTGIIAVNTTSDDAIKAKHGRQGELGGISGNEWEYRTVALAMATEIYERAGDKLEVIGVGGISTAEHALERLLGGASLLQVVTGIREHNGRTAVQINRGIIDWMERRGYTNVSEIVGLGTKRGPKRPQPA